MSALGHQECNHKLLVTRDSFSKSSQHRASQSHPRVGHQRTGLCVNRQPSSFCHSGLLTGQQLCDLLERMSPAPSTRPHLLHHGGGSWSWHAGASRSPQDTHGPIAHPPAAGLGGPRNSHWALWELPVSHVTLGHRHSPSIWLPQTVAGAAALNEPFISTGDLYFQRCRIGLFPYTIRMLTSHIFGYFGVNPFLLFKLSLNGL